MQFITTVTQKGQITLPKKFRDKIGINQFDKIIVELAENFIKVKPTKDILDLAGTFKNPKGKSVMKAREKMEKTYQRF